jgi:hypothetical protein
MKPIGETDLITRLKARAAAMPDGPHPNDDDPIKCTNCSDTGFETWFDKLKRYYSRFCFECEYGRTISAARIDGEKDRVRKAELKAAGVQARYDRTFGGD